MPIREYKCEKCDKVFEYLLKVGEPVDTTKCTTCGNLCERVISRSNFQLKGSGWYSTDYKKKR